MEFPSLVLFLGLCYFHWTTAASFEFVEEPPEIRRKLCQTNGTVESLSKLEVDEKLNDNCIELSEPSFEANVSKRGLTRFKHNWYQVSDASIINLSHNSITDITPELLNDLPAILMIDLKYNNITIIRKNIIENNNSMHLILGGNPIEVIEDDAFKKVRLTHLDVSRTALKNLDFLRTFPVTVVTLQLAQNKITEIPVGLFKNFHQLVWINLSSNQIKKIRNNTFSGMRTSKKAISIRLQNNNIDFIEAGSFSNGFYNMINLMSNNITDKSIRIGAFDHSYIKLINLSENPFKQLPYGLFDSIVGDIYVEK